MTKPRLLIACVGNLFLGDDAFGVEVASRLATVSLPEGVRVVDFGESAQGLSYLTMEYVPSGDHARLSILPAKPGRRRYCPLEASHT